MPELAIDAGRAPDDLPAPAVEAVVPIGGEALVLTGSFVLAGRDAPEVRMGRGQDGQPLAVAFLALDEGPRADPVRGVAVVTVPPHLAAGRPLDGTLVVAGPTHDLALAPADLAGREIDLRRLLGEHLAALPAERRADVIAFFSTALSPGHATVARALETIRGALRERLPHVVVARGHPQGLHSDRLLAIDESTFYVEGWLRDQDAPVVRLTAVSPEGARAELLSRAFRLPRADVGEFYGADPTATDRPGFIATFSLGRPSRLREGWLLEMANANGGAVESPLPAVLDDPLLVREHLLGDLTRVECAAEEFLRDHVSPALHRLQARLTGSVDFSVVEQHGEPPRDPDVTIIVPLYARIDLIEQQLATFADDPDIAASDLVYVLDSPELAGPLLAMAPELHVIYGIPFRVAVLERNVGFAAANNAAARLARGRLLLLLNSDVLAGARGWLRRLRRFHDRHPDIGALGPKLLFEDGSLQHAGIFFRRAPGARVWENAHYFKGMHGSLPAANRTRPVPAVTGACLMIDHGLYDRVGGLSGDYIQGDYEDSDLCLRLLKEGRRNWYLPNAELYHLEGRSYALARRQRNARYNAWLHSERWGTTIEAMMRDEARSTR